MKKEWEIPTNDIYLIRDNPQPIVFHHLLEFMSIVYYLNTFLLFILGFMSNSVLVIIWVIF